MLIGQFAGSKHDITAFYSIYYHLLDKHTHTHTNTALHTRTHTHTQTSQHTVFYTCFPSPELVILDVDSALKGPKGFESFGGETLHYSKCGWPKHSVTLLKKYLSYLSKRTKTEHPVVTIHLHCGHP